ncbi:MAG: FtsQ-type POTRA domain-containing protein [Bacilli bacterium]|nr:FtsQ-type POTRA domain-containing protein [Bacilli bacterium]
MKNKKKKYRLKYKKILIILLIIVLTSFSFFKFINKNITNIYIINNTYFSDQEIINIASLEKYPSTVFNSCSIIKKRLEKNILIKYVKVYKKNWTEVYIELEENRPLYYLSTTSKTVLLDSSETEERYNVPTVINYIPDTLYSTFLTKMQNISEDVLNRISEIKYDPNDVDTERFLVSMNDGNYVYLTLYKFESINNYIEIVKQFENKKGILYLDSGEYFTIME